MDNIQKCEKTVYHYIYENNPKAEELKSKIAEIKSHRTPPKKEDDVYYLRDPWRKFGSVGGFVMGWGWFRDEYIYAKATENDVEMAYNETKGGANG